MNLAHLSNSEYRQYCADMWRIFNRDYFSGKLLRCPYFKLFEDENFQGWHCNNLFAARTTISLNRKHFTNNTKTLCEILLHEMVHQEQWEHGNKRIKKEIHGAFFYRRAAEIKEQTGYNIVSMFAPRKGKK